MRSVTLAAVLLLLPACPADDKKPAADAKAEGAAKTGDEAKTEPGAKTGATADAKADAQADAGGVAPTPDAPARNVAPIRFVPEAASAIMGMNAAAFFKSKLWESSKKNLDPEVIDLIDTLTKCAKGPEHWQSVLVGMSPAAGEASVTAMSVEGLGKRETFDCIREQRKIKGQDNSWTVAEDGKKITLTDGIGHVVTEDLVVFTGADWQDEVQELVDDKGHAAADGAMKSLLDRADQTKHVWVAARVPTELATMAAGMLGAAPKDFTAWADLDKGLALHIAVGFDDAEAAAKALQEQWKGLAPMAVGGGLPQGVADSVKIATKDGSVTVDVSANPTDLDQLLTKVEANL